LAVIEERLKTLVREAASTSGLDVDDGLPDIELSKPRRKGFGDFSTNVALVLGPKLDRPPREVAGELVAALPSAPFVERVEIAGPGFINFHVTDDWLHDTLREIARRGEEYGRVPAHGRRVQVEFVSANPTGPLHIGHARNAVLGDALARLLEAAGWSVEREYYFNDAGGQMDRFGSSVQARYLQLLGRKAEVPEDGYHGAYLIDVARDIRAREGDGLADLPDDERFERLRAEGATRVLGGIRSTLERFGVRFDEYVSEARLAERGEIADAVERLRQAGTVYEADGAVWFRATDFGDDKDRVLIRGTGAHTYFAADCAYLIDKFRRGFDHLIYVWGADHHGDVTRVRGAARAMGLDVGAVEIVLYQFVAFLRGGEPVKMSKRAGAFISLDELIDEVGADAARFTLLAQSNDSTMNFDIEVVKRQSLENPVYYVQYGHARIASLLRNAQEQGVVLKDVSQVDLGRLAAEPELDLIRALAEFPTLLEAAAALRAPYKLTHYAQDLAARFHRFYAECRVLGDDPEQTQARLWLAWSTERVIANVLGLLGVSAPESMERLDA
jgi:arginyl-tRNA synthetase